MNQGTVLYIGLLLALIPLAPAVSSQSHTMIKPRDLDDTTKRPPATVADLAFLIGSWKGEFLGGIAEEVWMPPVGGSMVGTFRLQRDGNVLFYELMTVIEEGGSLVMKLKHFHPDLKGWEEKNEWISFPLVRREPETLWFDGLTLKEVSDRAMQVTLAIQRKDGSITEESVLYQAVSHEP